MYDCRLCAERSRRAAFRIVPAALCVLLLASCGFREAREHAEEGVKEFHALMNKGQYDAIYDASDSQLKKSWSRTDFAAYLGDIHSRLGMAGRSVTQGFQVNASTAMGTEVALAVQTEFDHGMAQERFVWHIEGERAVLVDYKADVKPSPGPSTV
jgi:hypothetical protein